MNDMQPNPRRRWKSWVLATGSALGLVAGVWTALTCVFLFGGLPLQPAPEPTLADLLRFEFLDSCLRVLMVFWWTFLGFIASCIAVTVTAAALNCLGWFRGISDRDDPQRKYTGNTAHK